jgi:hypothetical protein
MVGAEGFKLLDPLLPKKGYAICACLLPLALASKFNVLAVRGLTAKGVDSVSNRPSVFDNDGSSHEGVLL